ncbi:MAG: DUF4199 domain-containing protein [Bacteroidetes bacterium]|nr:DUF4199 domain-containing protein [Bacteroidota bacterium]
MQKLVLKFGLIAGAIVSVFLLVGMLMMTGADGKVNFQYGETFGYVSMIVALSMIFFGIRSYRDNHLSGSITFGKALKVGLLITLVASLIYVATWMVYYHSSSNAAEFGEQYLAHSIETMRKSGMAEADIAKKTAESEDFMKIYNSNPLVMFGVTLMEIFPVGLVISLLSSFILKRNPALA